MIDLHSHILPGLDDGPTDIETSLKMAGMYASAGIRHVVATPHFIPGTDWCPSPQKIRRAVTELNRAMARAHLKLTVYPGMEIALDQSIPDRLDRGELLPMAQGKTLLLETPFQRLPSGLAPLLFEIRGMGYDVMLAHPERCAQIVDTPQVAAQLAAAGVFLQLDGDSLRPGSGNRTRRTARWLLGAGTVTCIATDSHGLGARNPLSAMWIRNHLSRWIGEAHTHRLTHENPVHAALGRPVPPVGVHETVGLAS